MANQDAGAEFKTAQRQGWDSVAEGWRRWWAVFEENAQVVSDWMVSGAGVASGHRVLDIATGIGEPATTAARITGPEGYVLATDLADDMLAIAKERAESLGLTHLETRQMDGETLDTPDGSFDAVLCRWGVMFMPSPQNALAEMKRVLKPGGRVAIAVLGPPERMPVLSLPAALAAEMFDAVPPPPGTPGPFAMADPAVLPGLLTQAGFQDVQSESLEAIFQFEDAAAFANFVRDIAAPIRALVAPRSEADQERFWKALAERAAQYAMDGGRVALPGLAHCSAATKS